MQHAKITPITIHMDAGRNRMQKETEKITINLGVVELAQIDVLVEQGIYSNRTDLIRTAIRKQLETYEENIERVIAPIAGANRTASCIGILFLDKDSLQELFEDNGEKPFKINVVGMLKINNNVDVELFKKTVSRVNIRGKLSAPPEIKRLIEE